MNTTFDWLEADDRESSAQIPVTLPASTPTTPNPQFYDFMANPLKEGALTENSAGIGTVTKQMVRQRAAELAVIDGHPVQEGQILNVKRPGGN